ncbi:MAG: hypothetical protein QM296_12280 [Bacillota bacterium]|nr:hypothetical protein [Bacillota bacterium]
MSRGGQKLRWCPETGAGTKKLTTAGQKRPFVPRNRAQTLISGHRWTKIALVPRNRGRNEKIVHSLVSRLAVQHRRFLFLIRYCKAAANELMGSSCTGGTCCVALK